MPDKSDKNVDIVIVGGGLIGLIMLLALAKQKYNVLLIEAQPAPDINHNLTNTRNIVLSPASIDILTQLDIWPLMQNYIVPINSIHISQQYSFGATLLQKQTPLGYAIELYNLNKIIQNKLLSNHIIYSAQLTAINIADNYITIQQNANILQIHTKIIIAADGTNSTVRSLSKLSIDIKPYNQTAVISNIILNRPHNFQAYERFTKNGPLAMLPMQDNRSALIWCLPPKQAQLLRELSAEDFLLNLQKIFGYRLGKFKNCTARLLFPLQQAIMTKKIHWPLVFIGNAAQTLHPVAGQGLNLGLRDIAALAQCIEQYGLNKDMLNHYQEMRELDQYIISKFTDYLISGFANKTIGMNLLRGLGLFALDNSKFLQKILAHYTCGYAGVLSD